MSNLPSGIFTIIIMLKLDISEFNNLENSHIFVKRLLISKINGISMTILVIFWYRMSECRMHQ